jgi:hypothetical protein
MLHMFKSTQLSRLLIGQPRNFTSFRGIVRIIFVSNPHLVSYPMDPGITLPEAKPAGMVRMYSNDYITTHIRLLTWYLKKHRQNFAKFQVLTAMLLRIQVFRNVGNAPPIDTASHSIKRDFLRVPLFDCNVCQAMTLWFGNNLKKGLTYLGFLKEISDLVV